MGNLCVKELDVFTPCEHIDGQSIAARNILIECLDPVEGEIDRYFSLFNKMSGRDSDYVDCTLFLKYLQVEDTLLSRRLLAYFDSDRSGNINFLEFCINLYNLLAMRTELLGSYLYQVAEHVYKTEQEKQSKDKTILSKHMLALFYSLEGEVFGPDSYKGKAFKKKFPLSLSEKELAKYICDEPNLFSAFPRFLTHLERKTLGENYARDARRDRPKMAFASDPRFMEKAVGAVQAEKAAVKRAKEALKEGEWLEKRREDSKKVAKRRESKLLLAFSLHPKQKERAAQAGEGYNGPGISTERDFLRKSHKASTAKDELTGKEGVGTKLKVRKKSVADIIADTFKPKPAPSFSTKSKKSSKIGTN